MLDRSGCTSFYRPTRSRRSSSRSWVLRSIRDTRFWEPDGAASRFAVRADVEVKIRFIGGLAKGAIAELGIESMKDQIKVLRDWLEQMIDPALSST